MANSCYVIDINLTKVMVKKGSQIEMNVYCMIPCRKSLKEGKTYLWY